MMLPHINYWPVLAAAVLNQLIGTLWFTVLFGRAWIEAVGWTPEAMMAAKARAPRGYVITFLCSLIRAYTLAILGMGIGILGWAGAIKLGFAVGLGLVFASIIPTYYFANRPRRLLLIDAGNMLVNVIAASLVVTLWR